MKKLYIYLPLCDLFVILATALLVARGITLSSIVFAIGCTSIFRFVVLIIIYKKNKLQFNSSYKFFFYFYMIFTIISLLIGFALINWFNEEIRIL